MLSGLRKSSPSSHWLSRYLRYIKNFIYGLKQRIKSKIQYELCKIQWRSMNHHNSTTIERLVDLSKISVGESTYEPLNVKIFEKREDQLIIGNYCSIAEEAIFLLGGNHNMKSITTYPFKAMIHNHTIDSWSKGSIIIKDDVWIGHGATVLSGLTIGQGAVVAARAVVTKDVPPYAIVAGSPARIVKYRFSDKIIAKLLEVDLKEYYKSHENDLDLLYTDLTEDNVDDIILGRLPNN